MCFSKKILLYGLYVPLHLEFIFILLMHRKSFYFIENEYKYWISQKCFFLLYGNF